MAALAYKSDYKIDLEYLLTTIGFYTKASSISYIYAGSFIKYMVDKYGITLFKKYYLTGEIKMNYGYELSAIIEEYYSFLSNLKYSYTDHQAHYYFGRKSLFQKICPRAISEKLKEGWEQFGQFYFNPEGIHLGRNILEDPLIINHDLIVVDEIGPFELEGKIWADCLTRLLGRQYPSILLVVREALVPQVIHQWSLKDAMIIDTGRIKPGQAATMILSKTGGTRPLKRH